MFFSLAATAQDNGKSLPEVNVEAKQKDKVSNEDKINTFSPGQKVTHIDSIVLQQYKFQSVASLLSQQTPAFVKAYGFNGLATLNFRGSSAAQSLVLWNGVPLQNAALGIADISTMPVNVIDKVNIVYGSSAALWGSGNVGGALLLENDLPSFDSIGRKDITVSLSAGSYGHYSGGARIAFSGRKWHISANGFVQTAKNDFRYTNQLDVSSRMYNSKLYSVGVMMNAACLIDEKSTLSISGWYQHFDREIPAALFENSSTKDRLDQARRLMVHYEKQKGVAGLYFKSAIVEDKLYYNDQAVSLYSKNISYQWYSEFGVKRELGKHSLLLFLPYNHSWMKGTFNSQSRAGVSGALALNYLKNRLHISLQGSGQWINAKAVFLPGINASIDPFKWLEIKLNVQRTFRAPTLNELYYDPGGNSSLKPERGWVWEAGYYVNTNRNKALTLVQNSSFFYRDIEDWIIWYGGTIFTPHNIARVGPRGIETENMLRWRTRAGTLHLGLNTAYVIATTLESEIAGDGSIGKQIPYAPRYNGQVNAGFSYKKLYLNYNHSYTGYRFITTDESGWVEPYSTANVQLSYQLGFLGKHKSLQLSGQCNNIFNARYQVVASRPMPGINWQLGARFNLTD